MVVGRNTTKVLLNSDDSSSTTLLLGKDCMTMDSASRVGLDYIVENPDYVQKLASALESKSLSVKKQVFELLSALSVYSQEGYLRTLQALDTFKAKIGERYRFKFLVAELQIEASIEYKTSILAFINCLILASPDAHERIRTRCEFIGLKLIQVLNDLRTKYKEHPGLIIQLDVFDEQKESDESNTTSVYGRGIDLSSPLEVFDAILRQIAGTPQEVPFLSILQHLLSIDSKEPVSDLIWDSAERLVHKATFLESQDDALKLLNSTSQSKSLQKLKPTTPNGNNNISEAHKCNCNCHHNDKSPNKPESSVPTLAVPPPPPPPPATTTAPPPPPAPPQLPSLSQTTSSGKGAAPNLPRLPQQSIPAPKTKMKTVNWNKIPNGQILNNNGQNLWTTFSKKQANVLLDWNELEGLFCLQNDNQLKSTAVLSGIGGGGGSALGTQSSALVNELVEKNNNKKELSSNSTSELILLDAKRSLNINIFLKQFRSSNQEIIQLILNGNSQDFGSEKLRGLLKLLPSSDEVEMLNLVSISDQSRLGSAEKFLLKLIQINNYRLRIEAMLLKEELENCIGNIDSAINAILQAAQDIKNSEQFQQVIFMILVAGNFLNSGGYAGDAAGVKLSSLQKISDIRGNKPGISLLHFIVMQAEVRCPKLISFVNDMPTLEEASKISIEQLRNEINSLRTKVTNLTSQLKNLQMSQNSAILKQYGEFFKEAEIKISNMESYFQSVESTKTDLASFFCEEVSTFKIEDCFKIIYTFINKWRDAAQENAKRKKLEQEAENRRKAREEQFKKRSQLGLPMNSGSNTQLSNEDVRNLKGMTLNPDDDLFIACSPRIVRRRLGSLSGHDNMSSGSTQGSNDQLTLPSPDVTPNGSLRKRRNRLSSEEDESNLMDFLRSSGGNNTPTGNPSVAIGSPSMPRKLPGAIIDNQYGSLDRSWSRNTRRRPNLMEFVNTDRERPISPATATKTTPTDVSGANGLGSNNGNGGADGATGGNGSDHKHESPAREWRERITAWFVDLENGGSGEKPKRRPPPRRFQSRLIGDSDMNNRGLATLPEVETNPEDQQVQQPPTSQQPVPSVSKPATDTSSTLAKGSAAPTSAIASSSTYQRVYPDRRPSLKVNTDVVSAMEAIEEAQSPIKEKTLWRTNSTTSSKSGESANQKITSSRRSFIGSLGKNFKNGVDDEKLTLYIPSEHIKKTAIKSPEATEADFGTKEGFDRFASIRRSRRIKKDSIPGNNTPPSSFGKAPPGPDTPIPTRRFISRVDINDENNTHNNNNSKLTTTVNAEQQLNDVPMVNRKPVTGRGFSTTNGTNGTKQSIQRNGHGHGLRNSNLIEARPVVDLALNNNKHTSSIRQQSNFIPIPTSKTTPGAVSNNNNNPTATTTITPLSSSPAENDEGFEESPNSLTENNTTTEGIVLVNKMQPPNGTSNGKITYNNNNNESKSNNINNNVKNSSSVFSMPLIRRKSLVHQEHTTTTPLIESSSTTMHSNNGISNSNKKNSNNNNNLVVHHNNRKNQSLNSTPRTITNGNSTDISNNSEITPKATNKNNTGKVRILSFMRPTASSSAKDKLDALSSTKTNSNNIKTNVVNKRAFK